MSKVTLYLKYVGCVPSNPTPQPSVIKYDPRGQQPSYKKVASPIVEGGYTYRFLGWREKGGKISKSAGWWLDGGTTETIEGVWVKDKDGKTHTCEGVSLTPPSNSTNSGSSRPSGNTNQSNSSSSRPSGNTNQPNRGNSRPSGNTNQPNRGNSRPSDNTNQSNSGSSRPSGKRPPMWGRAESGKGGGVSLADLGNNSNKNEKQSHRTTGYKHSLIWLGVALAILLGYKNNRRKTR